MAVENKYVNADIAADKKAKAGENEGAKLVSMSGTFVVDAANDDGSIYRIIKGVNKNLKPVSIAVYTDGITGGTDFDLGFYKSLVDGQQGEVINASALAAALDLSAAAGRAAPLNGMKDVAITDINKDVAELAGDTLSPDTRELNYDIAFTGNVVGTATGNIAWEAIFRQA